MTLLATAPAAPPAAPPAETREELRARLFLRSLLPLLATVCEARPELAAAARGLRPVSIEAPPGVARAHVALDQAGAIAVRPGPHPAPAVRLAFRSLADMNDFFAGGRARPRLRGLLRHPLAALRFLRLLSTLRVLAPDAVAKTPAEKALRVKLVLYLVTSALSQLSRGGDRAVREVVDGSPERVYQWTVEEDGTAAYLRMQAGRTKAGRGAYRHRAPFVHFRFPTVEGAYRVFTTTGSQMEAVARGWVKTEGSPEYARKIGTLMQHVDALLASGGAP